MINICFYCVDLVHSSGMTFYLKFVYLYIETCSYFFLLLDLMEWINFEVFCGHIFIWSWIL